MFIACYPFDELEEVLGSATYPVYRRINGIPDMGSHMFVPKEVPLLCYAFLYARHHILCVDCSVSYQGIK